MENFNYDKKETYTQEELETLLNQHKGYIEKTEFKPKIKEFEEKLSTFEEKELFSTIKDDTKKSIIKDLMQSEKYKNLPKTEAFNKIKTDYSSFLKEEDKIIVDVPQKDIKSDNKIDDLGAILFNLHNVTDPNIINKIEEQAQKKGINANKDQKLMNTFIDIERSKAKNSPKK